MQTTKYNWRGQGKVKLLWMEMDFILEHLIIHWTTGYTDCESFTSVNICSPMKDENGWMDITFIGCKRM